ncbi:MAG: hypothetical protein JRE81_11960, partial [Deltaproteobacteria bacterium]|nr:hypothetical protein [Deltaproteobacteria bacterium]
PGSTATCNAGVCGLICDPGLERCGTACVDTQTDPLFCGDCSTRCPVGEECEAGQCFDPNDCRTNGIGGVGLTYCDAASGDCLPGCDIDAQCTAQNERCDVATHDCVCDAGFTRCEGACVNLLSERLHCGACGNNCRGNQVCLLGECFDKG